MISPASMKNGTAISGKLSAPLMMFCATICGVEHVDAMHQRDAADQQRKGDRHAERHRAEQRAQEDEDGHRGLLVESWVTPSTSASRWARSSDSCVITRSASATLPVTTRQSSCSSSRKAGTAKASPDA